jgi:hypothetical protein
VQRQCHDAERQLAPAPGRRDERGQAVIDEVDLHQERRRADEFDIGGDRAPNRGAARHAPEGEHGPEDDGHDEADAGSDERVFHALGEAPEILLDDPVIVEIEDPGHPSPIRSQSLKVTDYEFATGRRDGIAAPAIASDYL